MGLGDKLREAREHAKYFAAYDVHKIDRGRYVYLPKGQFASVKKPIAGAVAEYEAGSDLGGRTTLTRVLAGAVVAGPVGAIVGGMFKKDRSRGYVTVTFTDGDLVVVDGPLKDEPKLRDFASKINAAAVHYTEG